MRYWKRVLAVLVVALLALVIEGWVSNAQGAPEGSTACKFTKTPGIPAQVKPPKPIASTDGQVKLTLQTNLGPIELQLDRKDAPCAVHSLSTLAKGEFYDGSSCGKLTTAILECGPAEPGYHFKVELTGQETYPRGTVAMSNQGENASRFFLVHAAIDLPPEYSVVGQITDGFAVLDEVVAGGIGADERPATPTWIAKAQVG
jgi:peptidyl-prolyl cis-trans isomerase B (cyclophilin B)